jgi:hypothetical protein
MGQGTSTEDAIARFNRLLPRSSDCRLVILIGHLLIEEALVRILQVCSENPQYLDDARLTFHQRLSIARAISPTGTLEDPWSFVSRLNKIRNSLAHNADVADLAARVDDLLRLSFEEDFTQPASERERARFLRTALASCGGHLAGYADAFTAIRSRDGRPPK